MGSTRRQLAVVLVLMVAAAQVSCDYFDDDGTFQPQFAGKAYNSNDGTCSNFGESLDFYIDAQLVATVPSGSSVDILQPLGIHDVEAFVSDTGQQVSDFQIDILGANWYVWSGCGDGTHP